MVYQLVKKTIIRLRNHRLDCTLCIQSTFMHTILKKFALKLYYLKCRNFRIFSPASPIVIRRSKRRQNWILFLENIFDSKCSRNVILRVCDACRHRRQSFSFNFFNFVAKSASLICKIHVHKEVGTSYNEGRNQFFSSIFSKNFTLTYCVEDRCRRRKILNFYP